MERIVRVTGKGKLSVKPDMTRLILTMEETKPEYYLALLSSRECTETVRDLFEKLGFDRKELKTQYFTIDTKYSDYKDEDGEWKRELLGYTFVHQMKFEFLSDNSSLGRILHSLAFCKVQPKINIEYTVSDPEKYKNELLKNAVLDSKVKAEVLASAAGVKLGDIVNIDYSWGTIDFISRPFNRELNMNCAMESVDDKAYNLDIEADDIDVSDNVTVMWNIV